jgi:hypothetical protein
MNKKNEKNYIMSRFIICAPHQTVFDNNKNIMRITCTKSPRMRMVGTVTRMSGRAVNTGFRRDKEMEGVFGGIILEFSGGIWKYQEKPHTLGRKALGQCSDALTPQYETEHPDGRAAVRRT